MGELISDCLCAMGSLNRFNFLLLVILLSCKTVHPELENEIDDASEQVKDQLSAAESVGQGVADAIEFSTRRVVV